MVEATFPIQTYKQQEVLGGPVWQNVEDHHFVLLLQRDALQVGFQDQNMRSQTFPQGMTPRSKKNGQVAKNNRIKQ